MSLVHDRRSELLTAVLRRVEHLVPPGTLDFTLEIAFLGEPGAYRASVRILDDLKDPMPVSIPDEVHAIAAPAAQLFQDWYGRDDRTSADGLPAIHSSVKRESGVWKCFGYGAPDRRLSDSPRVVRDLPPRAPREPRFLPDGEAPEDLSPPPRGMHHAEYFAALLSAKGLETSQGWVDIKRTAAGTLRVRSGLVVVWDPLYFPPMIGAPVVGLPNGEHPVWCVSLDANGDVRPAAVVIACGRRRPVRWAVMCRRDRTSNELVPGAISVETGTVGFVDFDGFMALAADYERGERAFHKHDRAIERTLMANIDRPSAYTPDPNSGLTIIMSGTGGDGGFQVFGGFDAQGALACILTDFVALMDEDEDEDETDDEEDDEEGDEDGDEDEDAEDEDAEDEDAEDEDAEDEDAEDEDAEDEDAEDGEEEGAEGHRHDRD